MAEGRGFPWRGACFGLAALATVAVTAGLGAFASGVRLTRAAPTAEQSLQEPGARGLGLWQALDRDQRATLRRALGQAWRAAAEERAASRQARLRVIGLAASDAYDSAQMRQALADMRTADTAATAKIHDSLAAAMANLSPQERGALLAASARLRGFRGQQAQTGQQAQPGEQAEQALPQLQR